MFIGNRVAATSEAILKENGIDRIVNCTKDQSNKFEDDASFEVKYFRFVIYKFFSVLDLRSTKGVFEFFEPVFKWIDAQLASGHSVLIHCLAGAHRAGTTGVAYVMHAAKIYDYTLAIKTVQSIRAVVNPIHGMKPLLKLLGDSLRDRSRPADYDELAKRKQAMFAGLPSSSGANDDEEESFFR